MLSFVVCQLVRHGLDLKDYLQRLFITKAAEERGKIVIRSEKAKHIYVVKTLPIKALTLIALDLVHAFRVLPLLSSLWFLELKD